MDFLTVLFSKPTFLSVLGIGSIVLGIPQGIRIMRRGGPQAMMALFVFVFIFLFTIGFTIDRILISYIPHETLLLYEGILFLLIIIFSKYLRRKFLIYAPTTHYFILIENKEKTNKNGLGFRFPFNRKLKIQQSIHYLDHKWIRHRRIRIIPSQLWEFYTVRGVNIKGYRCDLYVQGQPNRPIAEIQGDIKRDLIEVFDLDLSE